MSSNRKTHLTRYGTSSASSCPLLASHHFADCEVTIPPFQAKFQSDKACRNGFEISQDVVIKNLWVNRGSGQPTITRAVYKWSVLSYILLGKTDLFECACYKTNSWTITNNNAPVIATWIMCLHNWIFKSPPSFLIRAELGHCITGLLGKIKSHDWSITFY